MAKYASDTAHLHYFPLCQESMFSPQPPCSCWYQRSSPDAVVWVELILHRVIGLRCIIGLPVIPNVCQPRLLVGAHRLERRLEVLRAGLVERAAAEAQEEEVLTGFAEGEPSPARANTGSVCVCSQRIHTRCEKKVRAELLDAEEIEALQGVNVRVLD